MGLTHSISFPLLLFMHVISSRFWLLLCRWHPTLPVLSWISACLSDIFAWIRERLLQLSLFKTEVLNLPPVRPSTQHSISINPSTTSDQRLNLLISEMLHVSFFFDQPGNDTSHHCDPTEQTVWHWTLSDSLPILKNHLKTELFLSFLSSIFLLICLFGLVYASPVKCKCKDPLFADMLVNAT